MKWIDVKESLPELNEFTLIYWGGVAPQVGCYKGDGKWLGSDLDFWIASEEITYWLRIPEPPKTFEAI